jgi:uncharacterized protein YggE
MFRQITLVVAMAIVATCDLAAQAVGNRAYGGNARSESYAQRTVNFLTDSTFLVEARVMMNVRADQFIAVFGVMEQGKTLEEGNRGIDERIAAFVREARTLGIKESDMFVDMITQARVYDYKIDGTTATQFSPGFEIKKNISLRFDDHAMIEKLVLVASKHGIYDLVKVDYLVNDRAGIYARMQERAAEIIAQKRKRYETITQSPTLNGGQIYLDEFRSRSPGVAYQQYNAFESGDVDYGNNRNAMVREMRKTRTFYFEPIDPNGFDEVIDPIILEPVVQFMLTLAVKYELR